RVHFKLGDTVSNARVAIGRTDTDYLTVGIADDGRLQRIEHGVATVAGVTTPTLSFQSPTQPLAADLRPVDLNSDERQGAVVVATNTACVTAAARNEVWLWKLAGGLEEWRNLGKPAADAARVTQTAITRNNTQLVVYAVADGKLYR